MPSPNYDIVTIGGGIAGTLLAKAMSDAGAKVLVIERELQFKDRVRGGNHFVGNRRSSRARSIRFDPKLFR